MIDSRLPESYRLVECDARYAEDALAMLRSILTELAASGREEYYYMSETDDEFRSYYSDPNFITLGVVRQDRLVACGTASFRREEAELFAPRLPERVPVEPPPPPPLTVIRYQPVTGAVYVPDVVITSRLLNAGISSAERPLVYSVQYVFAVSLCGAIVPAVMSTIHS